MRKWMERVKGVVEVTQSWVRGGGHGHEKFRLVVRYGIVEERQSLESEIGARDPRLPVIWQKQIGETPGRVLTLWSGLDPEDAPGIEQCELRHVPVQADGALFTNGEHVMTLEVPPAPVDEPLRATIVDIRRDPTTNRVVFAAAQLEGSETVKRLALLHDIPPNTPQTSF